MFSMVREQMEKCVVAIRERNAGMAKEVLNNEKQINIQEIAIDRDCENILALHTPVATDLRLVLATLKITNDLERIADSAKSLAKVINKDLSKKEFKWIEELEIVEMLEIIIEMLKEMGTALKKTDTKPALKAAKKDADLNDLFKKALKTTVDLIATSPEDVKLILTLLLMVRNLERSGDLTKNIAEEIVFQIEARVVKHKGGK